MSQLPPAIDPAPETAPPPPDATESKASVTAQPAARKLRKAYAPELPQDNSMQQDEWLLSYADMATLLLTMFVALLLNANFDKTGNGPGGGSGTAQSAAPGPAAGAAEAAQRFIENLFQIQVVSPYEGGEVYTITSSKDAAPVMAPDQGAALAVVKDEDLERIRLREETLASIRYRLKEAKLDPFIGASIEGDGIRLNIPNSILFATGEAELQGQGLSVLEALAPILTAGRFIVSVEGHTDNVPIKTERFPSNWELSAQRAATVVRVLAEVGGVIPTRLEAVGYGESRPLATNQTESGRQENRRVTLMLRL